MDRTLRMVRGEAGEGRPVLRPFLVRLVEWPFRAAAARRVLGQLGSMSDHELADIGLMRQDLLDATALEADEDPTLLLTARARERRQR